MNLPQTGILPEANGHALFITIDLRPEETAILEARKLLANTPRVTSALSDQYPEACLTSVAAVGPGAWTSIFGNTSPPSELATFKPRTLGSRKAPATPADILLHIRSERRDLNFELARRLLGDAGEGVHIREEVPGFRYLDSRDLTGFVDGTENPEDDERAEVALVGDEEPDHAGGSYVMLQRYVHDLARWHSLDQAEQEKIIGRTRDTDEELADDIKPESAHISRVVIEEDGEELEILRHSLPWGDSQRAGLVFIAYSRHREIFDKMLDRMFDTANEGVHDRLMDFTVAETGAFFFAPSLETLESLSAT